MGVRPIGVAICFLPAGLGLLSQGLQPLPLAQRWLALALGLMLMEQAHMARVDVQRWLAVRSLGPTPRLNRFATVLTLTILGELAGFYLAAAGWLGWGMVTILVSLLGFNLLANGHFQDEGFQASGPRARWVVIGIDGIALGLALLWLASVGRLVVASGLLGVSLVYGVAKLYAYATNRVSLAERPPAASAVHIPYATQQHPQPAQQNR